jgi:hypothetical protein
MRNLLAKFGLTLVFLVSLNYGGAQKSIPLQTFYKSKFIKYSSNESVETFFPANERKVHLTDSLKDSTILYYDFSVWFFKKNWIELKSDNARLEISPLVNFSFGKSNSQSDTSTLYRNTRGVYAEGQLSDKLTFNFVIAENQSRFLNYQNAYFNDRGEFYDNDSVFSKVNAVIPAGARTKPFKIGGYDYGFSFGSFAYQMNDKFRFEAGNNQHFIGSGYRSLLLSDNSIYAPYMRFMFKLSEKFEYQVLYRKHKNLYRKPATNAVESAYENKFYSANYLTFKPTKAISLSLFTAGQQLRGDSIIKHDFQAQMFIPLPFANNDLLIKNKIINGIAGLNIDIALKKVRIYGQFALDKVQNNYKKAFQLGFYAFDIFKITGLDFQTEANVIEDEFYESENKKLSYSQYNMALSHPKGNNFTEIYANLNYEINRIVLSNSFSMYFTKGGDLNQQISSNSIFVNSNLADTKGTTAVNNLELSYRINKKYNPTVYVQYFIRASKFGDFKKVDNSLMLGLKVNLFNQYLDF